MLLDNKVAIASYIAIGDDMPVDASRLRFAQRYNFKAIIYSYT